MKPWQALLLTLGSAALWCMLGLDDVPPHQKIRARDLATASVDGVGSADDGGPRQQPELSDVTTYSPEPEHPASDLSLLDDDDVPPLFSSQLDPTLQRTARLASLDPDDGIQL